MIDERSVTYVRNSSGSRETYPYKEVALEESLFYIFRIAFFSFVQAPDPVVRRRAVAVSFIANPRANTGVANQQHCLVF